MTTPVVEFVEIGDYAPFLANPGHVVYDGEIVLADPTRWYHRVEKLSVPMSVSVDPSFPHTPEWVAQVMGEYVARHYGGGLISAQFRLRPGIEIVT